MGFRLSALGLRSVFILLLARYLPTSNVGLYGVLTVTVSYAVYALGFDFYTYSTRELMRSERAHWPTILRSHGAFAFVLYAVLCPTMLMIFHAGVLPWSTVLWFYVLIPLEHAGAEVDRILIGMLDQLGASVCIFLGQGLMPAVIVPMFAFAPGTRSLNTVLAMWVLFDVAALLVGAVLIRKRLIGAAAGTVDWSWVRRGILTCIPFLLGTLCLRALFTADRQFLKLSAGLEVVAAYTVFMAVANGMTSVIYTGVHQFIYPHLVRAAHERDPGAYLRYLRTITIRTAGAVLGISAMAMALLPVLLHFVEDPAYSRYSWILPWSLVACGLYNLSYVPHYALYALDADRSILAVTVASLAGFIAVVSILGSHPLAAVLTGLVAANATMLGFKSILALRQVRSFVRK